MDLADQIATLNDLSPTVSGVEQRSFDMVDRGERLVQWLSRWLGIGAFVGSVAALIWLFV